MDVPRTLLVTNDFPPKVGGIQRTLKAVARELPADRVAVFAPSWDGDAAFDAGEPYRVLRAEGRFLWPTPAIRRQVLDAIAETGAQVVVFGDSFPLAGLAPGLARHGIPSVMLAHGFDHWLSVVPGARSWLRHVTGSVSRVAVCSGAIARDVRTAVPAHVPVSVLYPGADIEIFRPDLATDRIRERYRIGTAPLVVCVSRLIPRKGQDVLIRSMARIRRRVPDAVLLVVGDGPYRATLERLASRAPAGSVRFAGAVSEEDLPHHYAAADVFAMPCRSRIAGFEVEGWGSVFIEAAACGRPVVVGDSGGSREAVVDGETGTLVRGSDVVAVGDAIADLLEDRERAEAFGKAGRARVESSFTWRRVAGELADWLREAATAAPRSA
ncbi:MAG: glycosyltransferase family 4 protein [Actinomycetota bacterium]